MALCNIDFFDRDLNNTHHDISEVSSIDEDYLAITNSSLTITKTENVKKGDYINISGPFNFFGVVSEVSDSDYYTGISFKPFLGLFDHDIIILTSSQNSSSSSLESFIQNMILGWYVNCSDSKQKIFGLSVTTTSSTTNWSLGLVEDEEGSGFLIDNFYSALIAPALTNYKIAINVTPNLSNKTINLSIGVTEGNLNIDADAPNVKISEFYTNKESSETNKLFVYNSTNYKEEVAYYLHTDHTYDTNDSDRITPVIIQCTTVTPDEDQTAEDAKTFSDLAKEAAVSMFGDMEWTNLIELEVGIDDTLIGPLNLRFGQEVFVVHDGTSYSSILTGRTLANSATLTFGKVRLELSKQLKMGGTI